MKRIGLISILFGLGAIYAYPQESIVSIPDTAFLYALIEEGVDTNGDSLISQSEAEAITYLDVNNNNKDRKINNLSGIEGFVNLDSLMCYGNSLDSLDLSMNTALLFINCHRNLIKKIDVSNCLVLEFLEASRNRLTSINVSNNTSLITLNIYHNYLTSLDVSNNTGLTTLGFGSLTNNNLPSLDISKNIALRFLNCNGSRLTSLDVSNNIALNYLHCNQNEITTLDLSKNTALFEIHCSQNRITTLDVSNNKILLWLKCGKNQLTNLVFPEYNFVYTGVAHLYCDDNQFKTLDISSLRNLRELRIQNMPQLTEVCVWIEPFPPADVEIYQNGSPNICFQTDCNGNCNIAGIEESSLEGLSIYPNPTNTLLTIETGITYNYSIEFTSLNGQLLFSKEMEGTAHQLDLSSFQKGIYFITIRSKEFVTTRKIIKL